MSTARFSIGIDLGTTSSVMAYQSLQGGDHSEVFPVVQWLSRSNVGESTTLPSFLYLPEPALLKHYLGENQEKNPWMIGHQARAQAAQSPGRVVHSAKSWLCHHASDRTAPFLPFGSEELRPEEKMSPLRALALILNYFSGVWNDRFAASGEDFTFENQSITITVPASFDAVAQRLTLMAARDAGFPKGVRLIEEPQAAFYRWLERHPSQEGLWNLLPPQRRHDCHVLVVDIGGGTSDFSLFSLQRQSGSLPPEIRRVAVSDHILLGGDNIDLAIAHAMQQRLVGDSGHLSSQMWDHLVARCRDLKEKILADDGAVNEYFTLSITGRGSSLLTGTMSARLSRAEVHQILFDGFFPVCERTDVPETTLGAFKEWGLPYAADSAVTRHLAAFLNGLPMVDAVLFNGGSLIPDLVRERLLRQIAHWQQEYRPLALENREPDLAVALGAARYGRILHFKESRIEAGAPRAIFLEVHRKDEASGQSSGPPSLVCILPRGARSGERFNMDHLALTMQINRPVRFQSHYSTRANQVEAGAVVDWNEREFHPLLALETIVQPDEGVVVPLETSLPVSLSAEQNELGLLQVLIHSQAPELSQTWPLEFNLRPHETGSPAGIKRGTETMVKAEPNVAPEAMALARSRIQTLFAKAIEKRDKLTPTRLNKSLEEILGKAKGEWNWVVIRELWEVLAGIFIHRTNSVDHEETWLILAGYFLRPGFGAVMDEVRIDNLWRLMEGGVAFPGKRIRLQEYILWRRVAGGLDRQRQERLLSSELRTLRTSKNPSPELIRLSGALERLGHEIKAELIDLYLERAQELLRDKLYADPYLDALGLLLNRTPLYSGPEAVVAPEKVEQAFAAFQKLDWSGMAAMQTLFLQAARVVDNRSLDLAVVTRKKISSKLEKAGVAPLRVARILDFFPVVRADQVSLYGESLPPGLFIE
ncbi:MAG: Hsp70 family protein [Magnetococcales bacterium]|nr:Hsp70 family protein [Magnetococcales bacterium]